MVCMDSVVLIKIPFIQYLYETKSIHQTIKDISEKTIPVVSKTLICLNRFFHIF